MRALLGRARAQLHARRVGLARGIGPADGHLVARVERTQVVGEVVDRVDGLAVDRGDDVTLGETALLGRTIGDHAGDLGAARARGSAAGVPRVAGAPAVASEEAAEAAVTGAAEPEPEPELELPTGLTSTPRKAVVPMCTVDEPLPATIWWAMESAVLIGMAKPWVPEDWSLDWKEKPAEAAVSTPST